MFTIKQLISGTLIVAVSVLCLPQNATPQSTLKGIKNIVLVHGAFADGSCWSKVIAQLQAKGYNVIATQNPLTSLKDDAAAVKRAIDQADGPVLLVAHSFGGIVMSEVGSDPKVAGLLYVAAIVPEEGQSANAVSPSMPTTGIEKKLLISADGFVSLSMKAVEENFAPDTSPEERKLIYATQVPLAESAGEKKELNHAWKTKRSWFIFVTNDAVLHS